MGAVILGLFVGFCAVAVAAELLTRWVMRGEDEG